MSLLNKASLIQIPSGYKDGTLYSAKPTNGDGDFTFSRGSNLAATRVNSEGLIEKGRENLLLQSNTFDTTWSPSSSITVTGGQTGYDGSSDAWLLKRSDANARYINQSLSLGQSVYTYSVYAKAESVDWLFMWTYDGSGSRSRYFDLANGVAGATVDGTIDVDIESVGNGWYRCSITYDDSIIAIRLYPAVDNGSITGGISPAGIYIQDAQLEVGLVSTDYIETTTTTEQAGILEDMPRLDYSGGASCPSLLLEPQRTNLVVNSEYYNTSDWNTGNATATNNAATSPEGVDNAIKLAEATTISSFHYIGESTSGVTTAGTYSISGFVKKGTRKYGGLRAVTNGFVNRYFVLIDLDNGSLATTNTFGSGVTWSHKIEDYGNGWYRIEIMGGHTSGAIDASFSLSDVATPSFSGGLPVFNGSAGEHIFCYGVQKELGSYATSYIPTYGSSVTRSADSCSGAGNAGVFNDSEGVLYAEFSTFINAGGGTRRIQIQSSGSTQYVRLQVANGDGTLYVTVYNGSQQYLYNDTSFDSTAVNKVALRYAPNNFALYVNGVKLDSQLSGSTFADGVLTETNFSPPSPFYGNIKQTLVFSTALTDDELAALTTI